MKSFVRCCVAVVVPTWVLLFEHSIVTMYFVVVHHPLSLISAVPPVNDLCENALPYSIIGSTISGIQTIDATIEDDITSTANCPGLGSTITDVIQPSYPGVWYTFTTPPASSNNELQQRYTGRACRDIGVQIIIFQNGCNPSTIQCVAAVTADYSCRDEKPFEFIVMPDTTYHILYSVFVLNAGNDGDLTIIPHYDGRNNTACSTARPYSISTTILINVDRAIVTEGNSSIMCRNLVHTYTYGVWLTFTSSSRPDSNRLVARSCNDGHQTSISIFTTGSNGCSTGSSNGTAALTCVAYSTAGTCDFTRFIFDTIPDTIYHVLLQSVFPGELDFTLFPVAPIQNDICTNAEPYILGSTVVVDTTYASPDPIDFANGACQYDISDFVIFTGVWYTFVGTGGRVKALADNNNNNVEFIGVLVGDCTALECIVTTAGTTGQFLSFDTVEDTIYHVIVASNDGSKNFFIEEIASLPNDSCTNARPFTLGFPFNIDITSSSQGFEVSRCGEFGPTSGVWFTFTGSGRYIFAQSCNHPFETKISIYKGTSCDTLQCVDGTDRPCRYFSTFNIETERDEKYYVLLYSSTDGVTDLEIYETCGILGLRIFCPFTFRGIFARLFRVIFRLNN